jgi:cyclohexyl-isocyanide hydratase
MLVHPDMVLLEHVGPHTVFTILGAEVHLVWKDMSPVHTDVGLTVTPTVSFRECPPNPDVLFVPGGLGGTVALMDDDEVRGFLGDRGPTARYVTSVCTGSLLLGAAGLLRGFRATSHWYVRDLLALMGVTVAEDRVVSDRNRITAVGVSAGLDLGLQIAAQLAGEDIVRRIQLLIEYDPKPPFDAGSPDRAGPALADDGRQRRAQGIDEADQAALRARDRLGFG